ncbi:MAG TPA: D-sedoheptulose 7-phosphate isomerase [Oxalicibacterium sp.]|uniref:D-sedoheptulose 7-phosphate isomerase n=1 Tax=Oxalicibacterium sp. TaxID=2766525 RepID=UPI002B8C8C46|nr:D-sedoheptulose 7-phosphate isomerase [Oxalicibacterium sp.]HWU97634.1 D-sedoheptulose 7-phosphate isomerase [Oxalicibacterium sp.]
MNNLELLRNALNDHQNVMKQLESLLPQIDTVGQVMRECLQRGNKILLMGNGGSAADSQHIAAEIVGRYKRERRGLPAIALTTDTSILTAVGNDYGFDYVFSRQVEALCDPQDVVVGISTSGNSGNVVKAIEVAKQIGAITVLFSGGSGGKLADMCDYALVMPSKETARIQEAHLFIAHSVCEIMDVE